MHPTPLRSALVVASAVLAAALAAGGGAPAAHAQSKAGTTFGSFLLIEPSARLAGMGNAGVAFYEGLEAGYYNPAALSGANVREAQFTHGSWFADINYSYAALSLPASDVGSFFGSVTVLSSGDIDVRTVESPLGTGERYSVTDVALGVGYARDLAQRFAIGIQASYVQETIWNSSARTLVLSLGTLYRAPGDRFTIGASLSNFGTDATFSGRDLRITYDQDPDRQGDNSALPGEKLTEAFAVPVLFRVGVGMPYRLGPQARLRVGLDAYHANDNDESVSAGGELELRETLFVRAGWQNLFLDDAEMGPTLGAGLRGRLDTWAYRFDYAWGDYGRLGDTHRFTLGVSF